MVCSTISIIAKPTRSPNTDPSGPASDRYVLPVTTSEPHPMAVPTDKAQTARGDRYGFKAVLFVFADCLIKMIISSLLFYSAASSFALLIITA